MKQFKQKFIEDATELLEAFEHNILAFEKNPQDEFLIESIMRSMHTMKGSAAMFGFDKIVDITHKLESLYSKLQKGELTVSEKVINITFSVSDIISKLLTDDNDKRIQSEYLKIIDELNEFFTNDDVSPEDVRANIEGLNFYYINFIPDSDIEERGVNLKNIFMQLDKVGKTYIIPKSSNKPNSYHICWEIYLATEEDLEIIEEILIFVDLECEITLISDTNLLLNTVFVDSIVKLRETENILTAATVLELAQNALLESPGAEKGSSTKNEIADLSKQTNATIRVNATKLDDLMKRVSELITLKSEIKLIASTKGYAEIIEIAEKLEKVTAQLRDDVFEVRLVTLDSIRVNLERLIRDTAIQLKKEVQFTSEGLNTELDKTIVDKLSAPLMHIIRNSIDHGIESSEIRAKRNKASHGNIKIRAYRSGSYVYVQVIDDGDGINKEKLLKKAIERKLIKADDKLTNKEVFSLIFESGLSTAESLSSVSGRGVGMDVVKSEIMDLRGDIDVISEPGKGTTVTLKLPLSLSIIDTLLVQTGEMYFSIPIEDIVRCEISDQKYSNSTESRFIKYKEDLIPYVHLRQMFNITINPPADENAIIVKREERSTAIIVDKIIGQYQAVVKPLGKALEEREFLSGGSLMPDGNISYILDTGKLVDFYNN